MYSPFLKTTKQRQKELESGHLINKSKSCSVAFDKMEHARGRVLPIVLALKRCICLWNIWVVVYLLVERKFLTSPKWWPKLRKKNSGWKGKNLSTGGRLILIKRVSQSVRTHILDAFEPPFDVNLQRKGFNLASKCCCSKANTETVDHVCLFKARQLKDYVKIWRLDWGFKITHF